MNGIIRQISQVFFYAILLAFLVAPLTFRNMTKTQAYVPEEGPYVTCQSLNTSCSRSSQCCSGSCVNHQCLQNATSCLPTGDNSCGDFYGSSGLPCCSGGSCEGGTCIATAQQKCTPFDTIPKGNEWSACSFTCNLFGTAWMINPNDCDVYLPEITYECSDNGWVVQVNRKNGYRNSIEDCGSLGCRDGLCIKQEGVSCPPGDIAFNDQEGSNCLNICGADGRYHKQPNCGKVLPYVGINAEVFILALRAASLFAEFNADVFVELFQGPLVYDIEPIPGVYNDWSYADYGGDLVRLGMLHGGYNISTIIHEFTHHLQGNKPVLMTEFNKKMGCHQSDTVSETYEFTNEQPVSEYGHTNCWEAMAEAAEKYYNKPCDMQVDQPIQYDFIKNYILVNVPGCGELGMKAGSQPEPLPIRRTSATSGNQEQYPSAAAHASVNTSILGVHADGKLILSIGLGMTAAELTAILGPPARTSTHDTYTNYLYDVTGTNLVDRYVFDAAGLLVYFRVGPASLAESYRTLEPWVSALGNPQGLYKSAFHAYSHRLLYTDRGVTVVIEDSTKEVIQYESFVPMSLDAYTHSWGAAVQFDAISYKRSDFTADGAVDIFDYNILVGVFGTTTPSAADITKDKTIDIFDYNILVGDYGI